MRLHGALFAAALAACSRNFEQYFVSPDQKHVVIGKDTSLRSIEVDSLAEVGGASDVVPWGYFSLDGSRFVTRSQRGTIVVVPTAGGRPTDLGPAFDWGQISGDGSRVAFLRSCTPDQPPACADLYSAPSSGGEAVRVASGVDSFGGGYAFAGDDALVFVNLEHALLSAPADGTAPPLLLLPQVAFPPWTPGPQQYGPLVWRVRDGHVVAQDGAGLLLMSAKGGPATRIADAASARLFCQVIPDLSQVFSCPPSPAGSLAAIIPPTSGPSGIAVVSLTGGTSFTLSGDPLLFDRDGQLVFVDADGFLSAASPSGVVRQIGRAATRGTAASASSDGRWVAYTSNLAAPDLCPAYCDLLEVLSTATATTWDLEWLGGLLPIVSHQFSPDSSSILVLTTDGRIAIVPSAGGEPRFIGSDVNAASWAGPDHIVVDRIGGSPKGVQIIPAR